MVASTRDRVRHVDTPDRYVCVVSPALAPRGFPEGRDISRSVFTHGPNLIFDLIPDGSLSVQFVYHPRCHLEWLAPLAGQSISMVSCLLRGSGPASNDKLHDSGPQYLQNERAVMFAWLITVVHVEHWVIFWTPGRTRMVSRIRVRVDRNTSSLCLRSGARVGSCEECEYEDL